MTREEAIRIFDEVIPPPDHYMVDLDHLQIAQAWACIKETLKAEPVKHGKWIEDEYGFLVCSECGNTAEYLPILGQIETPYCSECGARMDEVEE